MSQLLDPGRTCWRIETAARFAVIVDDRVLKIGSANFNNRSMGFDTECDLSLDAALVPDEATAAALAARIAGVRDDLLAEHLGLAPDAVAAAVAREGSLVRAVDRFASETRRLQPLQARDLDVLDQTLAETDLVDPERPPRPLEALARRFSTIMRPRAEPRPALASLRDRVPEFPDGGA